MKWRILHVDDEPDLRTLVKATLEPKYEVLQATDGLDALEKLERYEPDMILLDVMMPLMDGFETATAIRKNTRFATTAIMFLSALSSKDDMKRGYASGANLYLAKPFEPARLLRNIDLYFDTTPPQQRARRYSVEELAALDKDGGGQKTPSSFHAHLPESLSSSSKPRFITPVPVESGPLPRVLVVDDTPEIIELVRLTLLDGYEVVTAHNGIEAIERLVKFQPDLMIADIMMPKMNGFQLLQSIRANRAFATLPVLICSAKATERDISFAMKNGASAFLAKPFMPGALLDKVGELAHAPGFKVKPKSMTMKQVEAYLSPSHKEDIFSIEDDLRHSSSSSGVGRSVKQLKAFLDREGDKDALDKPTSSSSAEEVKPKRRLFGFGGDKS